MIAVPTPFKNAKKADLSYVNSAAKEVASVIEPGNTIILESTVPIGTTSKLYDLIVSKCGFKDFFIAYCPERVLPGKIFNELINNDRVVGGLTEEASEKALEFYKLFVKGRLHKTDAKTAEMIKLVENSSRDVQIAFANQVAAMCEEQGINPFEVIDIANKHPRVNILNPGCGVGGHCIAVDPWFLVETFPKNSSLLKIARKINDARPSDILSKIDFLVETFVKKNKRKPKVLVLGLTFKADVDDIRNSPAVEIAQVLEANNKLNLYVCEPHVELSQIKKLGFSEVVTFEVGLEQADIIVILVGHRKFGVLKSQLLLQNKLVLDACGLLYKVKPGLFRGAQLTKDDLPTDTNMLSDILLTT